MAQLVIAVCFTILVALVAPSISSVPLTSVSDYRLPHSGYVEELTDPCIVSAVISLYRVCSDIYLVL